MTEHVFGSELYERLKKKKKKERKKRQIVFPHSKAFTDNVF